MADKEDELDLGSDGDFDFSEFEMDDEPQAEQPKNTREAVTKSLKDGAKGFMEDFSDDKVNAGLVIAEASIPKSLSKETDVIKDIHSNMRDDLEKATKEVRVTAKQTLRTVEKILPKNETVDKLVSKIHNFLGDDDETSKGPSKEELETSKIEGLLQDSLGVKTDREKMEQLVADQVETNRHKTNVDLLASIAANTERNRKFNNEIASTYFRKSLELQYRSLYTAKEQLKVMSEGMDTFKNQFESIIKNTALPDVVKMRKMEAFKAIMNQRIIGDVQDKLFKQNSLVSTVKENVGGMVNNVKDKVLEGLNAAGMIGDQAGMVSDLDAPGMSKGGMAGSLVAGLAKTQLGKFLAKKIAGSDTGKEAIYNIKNNMVDLSASAHEGASKLRAGEKPSFIKEIAAKILDFGGDVTKVKHNDMNSVSIEKDNLEDAAFFDGKAYSSLTKIIPGLLSKIYGEVKTIRVGGKPEDHELSYSHDQDRFIKKSNLSKDLKASVQSKISTDSSYSIDSFISILKDEGSLKKINEKETQELRKGIVKYVLTGKPYTPNKLLKNGFATMFPKKLGKKVTMAISNVLSHAKEEPDLINEIDDVFTNIHHSIPNVQNKINEFKKNGDISSLVKSGLVDYDKVRGTHTFNSKAYQKMILDATGNIKSNDIESIKDEIQSKKDEEAVDERSYFEKAKDFAGITEERKKKARDLLNDGMSKAKESKAGKFVSGKIDDVKNSETYKTIQESDTVTNAKANIAGLEEGVANLRKDYGLNKEGYEKAKETVAKKIDVTRDAALDELAKVKEDGVAKTATRYKDTSTEFLEKEQTKLMGTKLVEKVESFINKGVSKDSKEYKEFINHIEKKEYIKAGKVVPKLAKMAKEQVPEDYLTNLMDTTKKSTTSKFNDFKGKVSTTANMASREFMVKVATLVNEVKTADKEYYNKHKKDFDEIIDLANTGDFGKALKKYGVLLKNYTKYMHKRYGAKYVEDSKLGKALQSDLSKKEGTDTFKKGGYTGDGDPDTISGKVHKKEYVFNSKKLSSLLTSIKKADFAGVKDELLGAVKDIKQTTTDVNLKKKAKDGIETLKTSIGTTKENVDSMKDSIKKKVDLKILDLDKDQMKAMRDEFLTSKAYAEGKVKTFEEYASSLGYKLKNIDYTKYLDRSILRQKKDELISNAQNAIKDRLNPNMRTITEEEEKVLQEEFFESDAYKKGYVTQFTEWLRAKGLLPKLDIKAKIKSFLEKTRALDRKIIGGVPKALWGGAKLAGTGLKYGGKGLLFGGKMAAMAPLMTAGSVLRQLTGVDLIGKTKVGKKVNTGIDGIRTVASEAGGGIKGTMKGILTFMKNFKDEKKKEKKETLKEKLAKVKKKLNPFDRDGDGDRDGNWKDRLKGMFKSKKDKDGKPTGILAKMKEHKGLSTTAILLGILAAGKAMGITLGDVKNFTKGLVDGTKKMWNGIKYIGGVLKDTYYYVKNLAGNLGISIMTGISKIPGLGKLKPTEQELAINKAKNNGTYDKLYNSDDTPKVDKDGNPLDPNAVTRKENAMSAGEMTAYGVGGVLAYKLGGKHLVKGVAKLGYEAVKGTVGLVKGGEKVAAKKVGKKAAAKIAKEAAKKKIKSSAVKAMLGKVKNILIKKVGKAGAVRLLGKIASRFVPFAGWALLAYDAVKIGYDMYTNGTSFKSAVSKQILGFDVFDNDAPILDEDGNALKPDIPEQTSHEYDNRSARNTNESAIVTTKHSYNRRNRGVHNNRQVVSIEDLYPSNNKSYKSIKPVTSKDILGEIKHDHGFSKGKLLSDLIHDEGLRTHKYKDSLGLDTIGVGHLVDPVKGIPLKGIIGRNDDNVTKPEAYKVLAYDVNRTTEELYKKLPWLEQQPENIQRDLSNMAFNMGVKGLLGFTNTLKYIKNGDYVSAAKNMVNSKWYRQTGDRAKRIVANVLNTDNNNISGNIKPQVSGVSKKYINNLITYKDELYKHSNDNTIVNHRGQHNNNKSNVAVLPDTITQSAKQQHVNDALLKPMNDKIALQKKANESLELLNHGMLQSVDIQKQMLDALTIIAHQNNKIVDQTNQKEKPANNNVGRDLDKLKEAFPEAAVSLKRASY